jgi:hypothetical protein
MLGMPILGLQDGQENVIVALAALSCKLVDVEPAGFRVTGHCAFRMCYSIQEPKLGSAAE